jgi:segregation and condensation protein B
LILCESERQLVKLPEEGLVKVDMEIKQIVEAILFAANRPMTIRQVRQVFPELERPESGEIQKAVDAIIEDYCSRSVELKLVASGYRFQVKEVMAPWVSRLFEEKPPKYSRALLETLAIIAYRQPVTRGDIEDIRGVGVSSTLMRTLLDREWVRVVGHKEIPGRPALYSTTKLFLDYFDLSSLNELPTLQEIEDLESSFVSNSENSPVLEDDENQETTNATVKVAEHPEAATTLQ